MRPRDKLHGHITGIDIRNRSRTPTKHWMRVRDECPSSEPYGRRLGTSNSNSAKHLNSNARQVLKLDTTRLRTFLYETMAIINSIPLSVEHLNNPTGPEPLTPNHILTMKSSVILPPPRQFSKEDLYLNKRWRRVQFLANEFWQRWKREYLLNLQQ